MTGLILVLAAFGLVIMVVGAVLVIIDTFK